MKWPLERNAWSAAASKTRLQKPSSPRLLGFGTGGKRTLPNQGRFPLRLLGIWAAPLFHDFAIKGEELPTHLR